MPPKRSKGVTVPLDDFIGRRVVVRGQGRMVQRDSPSPEREPRRTTQRRQRVREPRSVSPRSRSRSRSPPPRGEYGQESFRNRSRSPRRRSRSPPSRQRWGSISPTRGTDELAARDSMKSPVRSERPMRRSPERRSNWGSAVQVPKEIERKPVFDVRGRGRGSRGRGDAVPSRGRGSRGRGESSRGRGGTRNVAVEPKKEEPATATKEKKAGSLVGDVVAKAKDSDSDAIVVVDMSNISGVLAPLLYDLVYSPQIPESVLIYLFIKRDKPSGESSLFRCHKCKGYTQKHIRGQVSSTRGLFRISTAEELARCVKGLRDQVRLTNIFVLSTAPQAKALHSDDQNIQYMDLSTPSISAMALPDFLTLISVDHDIVKESKQDFINLESHIESAGDVLFLDSDELVNRVVVRVAEWIRRNEAQMDVLPKTKTKFMNAIRPFCNLKQVVPGQVILHQLLTDGCLSMCSVCNQFTLNTKNLKRPSTSKNSELASFVNKCKEMLQSLSDVPSLPSGLLSKIGDYGSKKAVDPHLVMQQCFQAQLIYCEEGENVNYDLGMGEELLALQEEKDSLQPQGDLEIAQVLDSEVERMQRSRVHRSDIGTIDNFDNMGFSDNLLRGIYSYGFEKPSQIQQRALPFILAGKSVLYQSASGTGKTAPFALGALHCVDPALPVCQVLILAPTRELAMQIHKVVFHLGEYMPQVRVSLMVGGTSVSRSIRESAGQILVGTAGRVMDMITRGSISTASIKMLIIDEAGDMLSSGKTDVLRDIVTSLPSTGLQVVMAGTTISPEQMSLTEKIDPSTLWLLPDSPKDLVLQGITNYCVCVETEEWKMDTLVDLLNGMAISCAVIFCATRRKVDWLQEQLGSKGLTVSALHGDIDQNSRDLIMTGFRSGSSRILITLPSCFQGLDVQMLDKVFNYDMPHAKDFLHQVGRCGRFGRPGCSVTLYTREQKKEMENLKILFDIKEDLPAVLSTL